MRMTREEARIYLKDQLQDYLENVLHIDTRRPFKCLNPSHEDRKPSMSLDRQHKQVHCFSCGAKYDLIDLISIETGLTGNDLFLEAYRRYGLDVENDKGGQPMKKTSSAETSNAKAADPKAADYQREIAAARAQVGRTDYLTGTRKISAEVVKRHGLGFNPAFKTRDSSGNFATWQAIIIPTSEATYVARNTDPTAGQADRYRKRGNAKMFNADVLTTAQQPIFITEGEIDALSVETAGGIALALGSKENAELLLKHVKAHRPTQPLIIAMDSDEPGREAEETLARGLSQLGLPSYRLHWQRGKDANAILCADNGLDDLRRQIHGALKVISEARGDADPVRPTAPTIEDGLMIITTPPAPEADTTEEDPATVALQAVDPEDLIDAADAADAANLADPNSQKSWDSMTPTEQLDYIGRRAEYISSASAGANMQAFLDSIAERAKKPAISSGFTHLDTLLNGGFYEGLYVIGAGTSLGKTALTLQIADSVAAAGHDVLIASLEMARFELMARSISRHTLLEVKKRDYKTYDNVMTAQQIMSGRDYHTYSTEQQDVIRAAKEAYEEYADRLYILEGIGQYSAASIREAIADHIAMTGRTPFVIVDYLQILAPYDPHMTDKQNADKSVLELKRASRDYKTPVVAVSSLNRETYKNQQGTPVSEVSFKESGGIEYGVDALMGFQLEGTGLPGFKPRLERKRRPRIMELHILKYRNGGTGDAVRFAYYAAYNYLESLSIKTAEDIEAEREAALEESSSRGKR